MEHGVPLDRLPAGLHFPPEFEGRIRYDADRRRLAFLGFMSRADFDTLSRLSPDWPYRRAVEELFRSGTADDAPPRWGLRRLLASVSGMS
ncbi:hypothetical protein [Tautonia plasticadhaerens]|uniref:Uncharacterized protein n=1 Tax=Tautonia plasticadhaerens TaxID=2527974 RepID=A0A518HDG2_9BACT|nr:hypothetical protein [Tautonia plasticadhaerens]QDV38898.1 hypothetical protein ElP_68580 [Tautonia plasticadhaerens]